MLVYKEETFSVTSKVSSGKKGRLRNFLEKSVVSWIYEGNVGHQRMEMVINKS